MDAHVSLKGGVWPPSEFDQSQKAQGMTAHSCSSYKLRSIFSFLNLSRNIIPPVLPTSNGHKKGARGKTAGEKKKRTHRLAMNINKSKHLMRTYYVPGSPYQHLNPAATSHRRG